MDSSSTYSLILPCAILILVVITSLTAGFYMHKKEKSSIDKNDPKNKAGNILNHLEDDHFHLGEMTSIDVPQEKNGRVYRNDHHQAKFASRNTKGRKK